MVHDAARVAALRKGIEARLDLIASLEGRIVKGKLAWLEVARNQTQDVETVLLRGLEQEEKEDCDC